MHSRPGEPTGSMSGREESRRRSGWLLSATTFDTEGLEEAFTRKRNMQLMRLDATWAVMWLIFQCAGISKFNASERRNFPLSEIVILIAWGVWMPLLLLLIRFRTHWYARNRNWVMCALKLCRTLMVLNSRLPWREAKYVGSYSGVPQQPWQVYLHLIWKVNALFFGALTFVTPLRFALPIQLTSLLATLVFSAQRCRLECGAPASSLVWPLSAAAWPQSCPATDGYGAAAAAAAEAAAGLSCLAPADPQAAERYYGAAASWFSRALPLTFDWNAWSGSSDWQPGKACLPLCFSVHAWLQAVGGVLLPLALLWAIEERLRCREVCALQQQRRQQQAALAGSEGAQQEALGPCRSPQPLTAATLVSWVACSAWVLWATLGSILL
ncbi:hypothetical protein D9Q98_007670 [Chlorella vulgaris]|uniref:Uncharacterized protein n=1 Tax=Chlorella vulgaris TaxID=3077 RepID=A0A9D4THB1_CHLVU|nr:hypothetical protein D9Q98_007670 [Chlorella vulgaris]